MVQELYLWDSVADAGRRAIKMRYQLLPHLYTAFHQANKQGSPVAKPLWFAYPQDPATHAIDDQWLFGDVLITPILDQVSLPSSSACVEVHIWANYAKELSTRSTSPPNCYYICFPRTL